MLRARESRKRQNQDAASPRLLIPALGYDDVLLVPRRSRIASRSEVSTRSRFTRRLEIEVPILSANMDTITTAPMAVAMAQLGAIGIVHRFLSVRDQAAEIEAVKRHPSTVMADPVSTDPDRTVGEVRDEAERPMITGHFVAAADSDIDFRSRFSAPTRDMQGRLAVGASIGVRGDYLTRAKALLDAGADVLVIDVAHGHSDRAIEVVREVKTNWPEVELVAGNVVTAEGVRDLALAGADAVKVGIGSGHPCTTSSVAGVGRSQLTAVLECADAGRELDVPIVADGGIRRPGDVAKAIAAGASTVMVGNVLAGRLETPGEVLIREGQPYKAYRGMASRGAFAARIALEGRVDDLAGYVPEGEEIELPLGGPVADIIMELRGGLRSAMSYSDSLMVPEFWEKAVLERRGARTGL
jgi:IMP dehydrogenase/GMP reductase